MEKSQLYKTNPKLAQKTFHCCRKSKVHTFTQLMRELYPNMDKRLIVATAHKVLKTPNPVRKVEFGGEPQLVRLSEQDIMDIKDLFISMDINGDMELDMKEIRLALEDFHERTDFFVKLHSQGLHQQNPDENLQSVFKNFDTDENGVLDIDEFTDLVVSGQVFQWASGMNTFSKEEVPIE